MRLLVQHFQHRLRVYERAGAAEDDVQIVKENTPNSDKEGLDDGTIPHPKNLRCYGREQRRESRDHGRDYYNTHNVKTMMMTLVKNSILKWRS